MLENIFILIILLFSVILHEVAHGSVALSLGDPTAKYAGRLTLNPLKHLDPFGSFILPISLLLITGGRGPIVGFAKPVPINPYNFRDQKWGQLKVAIAGPGINFLVAIFLGLLIRFLPLNLSLSRLLSIIVYYNFFWGLFNLVPIPPLDGSHILFTFLSEKYSQFKIFLQKYAIWLLIFFILFGLNLLAFFADFLYSLVVG
jgi:Zn-dependent protease